MSLPFYINTISSLTNPGNEAGLPDGRWVAAIREPYTDSRLKAAWWVLTGRAYAFIWPKDGELEAALSGSGKSHP